MTQKHHFRMWIAGDDLIRTAMVSNVYAEAAVGPDGRYLVAPTLDDLLKEQATIVWAEDDKFEPCAVAYVAREGDAFEMRGVYTLPDARGRGLAEESVRSLIDHLRARSETKVFLTVRLTDDGLPPAPLALYEKLGFKLLPGVYVKRIGFEPKLQHLRRTGDNGGRTFRFRKMLKLFDERGVRDAV